MSHSIVMMKLFPRRVLVLPMINNGEWKRICGEFGRITEILPFDD